MRIAELETFYSKHNPTKAADAKTFVCHYKFLPLRAGLAKRYGEELIAKELPGWRVQLVLLKSSL